MSHLFFADDLLLFAEASIEQITVILYCLHESFSLSEQVSFLKSNIFFSKLVIAKAKETIVNKCGFTPSLNLELYLGAPSIHSRMRTSIYQHLIDRVDSRLHSWKTKYLLLASRITLANSVLNSIPIYVMQSAILPVGICKEIDKRVRQFI